MHPKNHFWAGICFSVIFMELLLHLALGLHGVISPILYKQRYGGTITVPVFQNGLIVGNEPPVDHQSKHAALRLAGRALRLFWQGFTLDTSNQGYGKLRAYRRSLTIYEANPFVPYVRRPGVHRSFTAQGTAAQDFLTDENGFLVFPEPSGRVRTLTLMTLGASTTDSPYPFYLWRYLNGTQDRVGIRLINIALPSYSTADNIAALAFRGVDYHPDLVIFYEANNDMFPSYSRDFRSDYSHWRKTFDAELMARFRLFDRLPRFLDGFAIYAISRNLLLGPAIRCFNWGLWGPTTRYAPDLTDAALFNGLAAYRRNLLTLQGIAAAHGAQVLLVTQTHQKKFMPPAAYAYAERMNQTIREIADLRLPNVWEYDFARELSPRIDELMVRDEVHFDDAGYKVLGETIGAQLRRRLAELPRRAKTAYK